ncbi:F0F1 ATP synthase subunit delta [Paenarthrobacter sp. DKR-5]|uniref:F0F1 ATP synthase subunit delta n=1 Tax=Paenarthrobacter sp. DKR-5 TaxID=2835535 RepID=UPI001BDC55A2|nr:F0F1 ATP synthase subunit delta [Paenarthrobacter sp. DKR-5]MBT1003122.1 F0F1 ATP synthase subunit delta [Paenarthrobacter sp. DKR-5]
MAGASSESLAKALAGLETKLPAASLSLAEELFGILGTVDDSAALRRALTDPARSGEEKAGLVTTLFGGKVSAEALEITRGLAESRWGSARDISDALETVAAAVVVASEENRTAGGTAGLEALERLENELFAFNRAVQSSHDLQRALSEPQASPAAKTALALRMVPGAGDAARLLISQAVSHPRGLKPVKLVERFVELVASSQKRWIAEVAVTRPLTAAQADRLQAGLNALYGRELKVNMNVDPSLIGGVRVRVGDEVVDASVITRLGELRRQLAG